jgi:hypothetical protein
MCYGSGRGGEGRTRTRIEITAKKLHTNMSVIKLINIINANFNNYDVVKYDVVLVERYTIYLIFK